MAQFCINKNRDRQGDNEVHNITSGCSMLPQPLNRVALGEHINCRNAVALAKRLGWTRANGCYYCARACHTS